MNERKITASEELQRDETILLVKLKRIGLSAVMYQPRKLTDSVTCLIIASYT